MRVLVLPVLLLTLALGGCAAEQKSVLAGGSSITATVANPVGPVDLYRAKNVYSATLKLAVSYREFCWSKPYAALVADPITRPVCQDRRKVVRAMQAADTKANAAIKTAENFVRRNPTLSAVSVVGAAWQAVTDFQAAVPRAGA